MSAHALRRDLGPECRVADPQAMQEDRQFARHGDTGFLPADSSDEPQPPVPERRGSLVPEQQRPCRFKQQTPGEPVAAFRNHTRAVDFARLVAPGSVDCWKRAGLSTVAAYTSVVTGPTPGTVITC
jgi:hypothetical protein